MATPATRSPLPPAESSLTGQTAPDDGPHADTPNASSPPASSARTSGAMAHNASRAPPPPYYRPLRAPVCQTQPPSAPLSLVSTQAPSERSSASGSQIAAPPT